MHGSTSCGYCIPSQASDTNCALPAAGTGAPAGLLRLGMLMAVTMTLHNMPEGFAVAFSAVGGRPLWGAHHSFLLTHTGMYALLRVG